MLNLSTALNCWHFYHFREEINHIVQYTSDFLIQNLVEKNEEEEENVVEIDRKREPRKLSLQPKILQREVERLKLVGKVEHMLEASRQDWWDQHFECKLIIANNNHNVTE